MIRLFEKILFINLFLLLLSCAREKDARSSNEFFQGTRAQWIQDDRLLPEADSLFYLDRPAPFFRKEFNTSGKIKGAKLYITAAGYYKASLNGTQIGRNELDPAWTDYSERIYYTTYDVTSQIVDGDNCLGVILGNGFYNPLPMRKWGHRNLREDLKSVGNPEFVAKLVIVYDNGNKDEIVTDPSWKFNYGPIIRNSIYIGVTYDARKEISGWNIARFNDSAWKQVQLSSGPGGNMLPSFFPPVRITREITPLEIWQSFPGTWMVDMGENFTGTYKIRLSGEEGDTIQLRFGERIYDDRSLNPMTAVAGQIKRKGVGGPGAPDTAWQADTYIVGPDRTSWFKPEFTYHTFRYMEIKGLEYKPEISSITGLFIHSDVTQVNSFSCSSPLLNDIQKATQRTFLANLVSVQSDCPAREKFGYGGDLTATNESFIYNFDMQAFYRKTIYDWVDAMNDSTFVDTAPFVGIRYCGISWESAFLITQYMLYLYYNDVQIIEEMYNLDKEWMDKVAHIHPDGIVDDGLSDHESLEPVPVELTGTCHYLQCARIMKTFASVMGDNEKMEEYEKLGSRLEKLIRDKFWKNPVSGNINRQTLFSTLLYHGIVPLSERSAVVDSMIEALRNGPSGHFNTGIFGTKYALETLSRYVSPDTVLNVINSTEFPGWGYMINHGATTIWETWKESDNTYSNCHPMFGSVTEWFYRWLAGIQPDPAHPGFQKFTLIPSVPQALDHVRCTYYSPYGKIISNWERINNDSYSFVMVIPDGSKANVVLPVTPFHNIEIRSNDETFDPSGLKGLDNGKFELEGGEYFITITNVSE